MVKMTTATTGTGTITLGSASSGFQSFADAYGANATVDVLITDGTAWEVARNCTYTHSGTTLTRGTLEDSSTGSALNLTGSAVVSVVATAAFGNRAEMALQAITPGGRLTTESGVPVSTSDRTAQSTLYYTPYVHNIINLWDGAEWKPISFTEHTVTGAALTGLTSGKPYDVFAYLDSGALATELLVWTNDTTRATAVTLQDGRYCKSGDKTRLLLGTIYTTGTTTTEDSAEKRYVANVYNLRRRALRKNDSSTSWSYGTAAWRAANDSTSNRVTVLVSVIGPSISLTAIGLNSHNGASGTGLVSIGENSTTAFVAEVIGNYSANTGDPSIGARGAVPALATLNKCPPVGLTYYQWLEYSEIVSNTFFSGGTIFKSGLSGFVEA